MKVHRWRKFEQHPLGKEYDEVLGDEFEEWLEDFKLYGNIDNRPIMLYQGKILDGWNLYRCHLECDVKPTFRVLNARIPPEKFIAIKNDHRRHETRERIHRRAEARLEKLAEMAKEGASLRTMAEAAKVSTAQVQRDLAKLPGATGGAPGPRAPKTVGKDGKKYESAAVINSVFCPRCTRIGKPVKDCKACDDARTDARYNKNHRDTTARAFDWRGVDKRLEAIANLPDEIGNHFNVKHTTECKGLARLLDETFKLLTEWRKSLLKL
jgi:hypothetical protein